MKIERMLCWFCGLLLMMGLVEGVFIESELRVGTLILLVGVCYGYDFLKELENIGSSSK